MDEKTRIRRNLNPTPEARVAMIIWGKEYSRQGGGSMDFYDRLDDDRKVRCRLVVRELLMHWSDKRDTEANPTKATDR